MRWRHLLVAMLFPFALSALIGCAGLFKSGNGSKGNCPDATETIPIEEAIAKHRACEVTVLATFNRKQAAVTRIIYSVGRHLSDFTASDGGEPVVVVEFGKYPKLLDSLEPGTRVVLRGKPSVDSKLPTDGNRFFLASSIERAPEEEQNYGDLSSFKAVVAAVEQRNASLREKYAAAVKANTTDAYLDFLVHVYELASKEIGLDHLYDVKEFLRTRGKGASDPVRAAITAEAKKGMVLSKLVRSGTYQLSSPPVIPGYYPYALEAFMRLGHLFAGADYGDELARLLEDVEMGNARARKQALGVIYRYQLNAASSSLLKAFNKSPGTIGPYIAFLHSDDDAEEKMLAKIAYEGTWKNATCSRKGAQIVTTGRAEEISKWGITWGCDSYAAVPIHHPRAEMFAALASTPLKSRSATISLMIADIKRTDSHVYEQLMAGDWKKQHLYHALTYLFRHHPKQAREVAENEVERHVALNGRPSQGTLNWIRYVGSVLNEHASDLDASFFKDLVKAGLEFANHPKHKQSFFRSEMGGALKSLLAYLAPKLGASKANRVPFPEIEARVLKGISSNSAPCFWLEPVTYFDLGPDVEKRAQYLRSRGRCR